MAVRIRLKRMGAKKKPFYRLVATDSRSAVSGKFIEILGHYNPLKEPEQLEVNEEKVRSWLARGAKPSDTARRLLVKAGIIAPEDRATETQGESAR